VEGRHDLGKLQAEGCDACGHAVLVDHPNRRVGNRREGAAVDVVDAHFERDVGDRSGWSERNVVAASSWLTCEESGKGHAPQAKSMVEVAEPPQARFSSSSPGKWLPRGRR